MNEFRRHSNPHRRQRGAVLFISLIMLLLLTLIGITAMQVTLLQERMAGGFRVQHQAFQQTEGTLKSTRKDLNDAANSSGALYYSADATLTATNALPWATWLTTEPAVGHETTVVRTGLKFWYDDVVSVCTVPKISALLM